MSAERGRAILAARLGRSAVPSAQVGQGFKLLTASAPSPGAVVEGGMHGGDAVTWGGALDMRAAVAQQSECLWELVSRMQQLLEARDRSSSEVDALHATLEEMQRSLADALSAKDGVLARLASQEARINAAAGRAAAAEAAAAEASQRSMVLEQDLHTALIDAQALGTELDDARSRLAAAESDADALQRQLHDALAHMDAQRCVATGFDPRTVRGMTPGRCLLLRVDFASQRQDLDSKAAAADAERSGLRAELEASRRCVEEVRKDAGLCSDAVDVLSAQCADMQAAYSQAVADAVRFTQNDGD